MKLIFATNNRNKVEEIRAALPHTISIQSLSEAGIHIDIPEPHATLEENALEKAKTIYELTGSSCFSEDTGLEVFALNNEPGVKSARYAGEEANSETNIEKLLSRLKGKTDLRARFRTVICLVLNGAEHYFEGVCNGRVLEERRGKGGFGYDPVFVPDGEKRSFAEMTIDEKNAFSHRKKALDKLVVFLNSIA